MKKITLRILAIMAQAALLVAVYVTFFNSSPAPALQIATIQQPPVSTPEKPVITGVPTRIRVPASNIDIAIEPGSYNTSTNEWTLKDGVAHYADIMPLPNDAAGNTFIYDHNNKRVFAKLVDLQPGSEAFVTTANGYEFSYLLMSVADVEPSDTSLFSYTGQPIMTVQTCSGAWYQDRRLFTFALNGVRQL